MVKTVTPRQFLEKVVQPNVTEFYIRIGSERHAYNAVAAVDALAAHIYVWCTVNSPSAIDGTPNDSVYRAVLA